MGEKEKNQRPCFGLNSKKNRIEFTESGKTVFHGLGWVEKLEVQF
jgi:hypothetical protein